jgi:N-acetylglucosamine-6-sulfatase
LRARARVLGAAIGALACLLAGLSGCGGGSSAARPNVVVIMTDDQTLHDLRFMPKTRKLVGGAGATFDNYFVSYPTCCPSRATLLTGEYAHNHGVLGNNAPQGGYYKFDNQDALPVWLQRAGYYTIHIGKYLNQYGDRNPAEVPPGWSDWHGATGERARRYWGYPLNDNGAVHTYGKPQVETPALYQTDVYSRLATNAIRREAGKHPFFLNVWTLAPHAEGPYPGQRSQRPRPAPRDNGAFANQPLPVTPAYNEADVSDKPSTVRALPPIRSRHTLELRYRARLASLLAVDDLVGNVIATLRDTGQLDNTYVFFTSDNGFFNGEHRIDRGKELPYEPSVHLPLLLRGPGIPAGGTSDAMVANIDLAPTILQATGANATKPVDGESLLPLARHPARRSNRPILLEDPVSGISLKSLYHPYEGVRTRRYLYVEYANGERELYDLARDPFQLSNQAENPAFAVRRRKLAGLVARLRHCRGADCRAP